MRILIPTLSDSFEDYIINILEHSNILLRNNGEGGEGERGKGRKGEAMLKGGGGRTLQ